MMSLQEITLHTIRQHRLIPAGSTVVVGVSGGVDSLALLHVLHHLASVLGVQLHAATFDHQLRSESSAADVRFVEQTAREWGILVTVGKADVRQIAEAQRIGIEVAARQARYDFLASVAREVGASLVAVAHHADDQAETVFMHILRGSGTDGLSGMALQGPVPGHADLTLIRPFLKIRRAEIERYCQENVLHPHEDVTNQDIALLRNRLRWETLPYLEKLNPSVRRALVQLGDIAGIERDYLEQQLQQVIANSVSVQSDSIAIDRQAFRELHPALQRRFIYWATQRLAQGSHDAGYIHIIAAAEMTQHGRVGAVALLSGGLRLRIDYETLVIERKSAPERLPDMSLLGEGSEIVIFVPGSVSLSNEDWILNASTITEGYVNARLALPSDSHLILRTRREGDRFAPLGMGGHTQKIGRWMINRKIPEAIRNRVPLLVVNGQIAAILMGEQWAISEVFSVKENTESIVYFTLRKKQH